MSETAVTNKLVVVVAVTNKLNNCPCSQLKGGTQTFVLFPVRCLIDFDQLVTPDFHVLQRNV
jgi:hypothetical protein